MTLADSPTPSRTSRRYAEAESSQHSALSAEDVTGPDEGASTGSLAAEQYRIDLERIRFSPYFGRLSDVTQVVPLSGVGPMAHNRLTHSLKVSAVARVIAANLAGAAARHRAFVRGERADDDATGATIEHLGGCDTIVAQAAAHAHDLGHPPFGHLGERVLDRIAREKLGLLEGFEGNAQSFRILVQLDTLGRSFPGLNLTAGTRAATLKYPWTRGEWIGVSTADLAVSDRRRGVGADAIAGAGKFSAYALDGAQMEQALRAFPTIARGQQTVECAVMDLADDIAYAVHDLDEFARAGVLQQAEVAAEFRSWLSAAAAFAAMDAAELAATRRVPGTALELLWRRASTKDSWIADRDAFAEAVQRVSESINGSLLAAAFDGGIDSERAVSGFTRRWIEHLRTSVVVERDPHVRSGHVRLNQRAWHEVIVLKFVHAHFVLERPELALPQRGQARIVSDLTLGYDAWLTAPDDAPRAPRRLQEWVEEVTENTFALRDENPDAILGDASDAALRRQSRGRAIVDYVSSLSDQQAIATHRTITGIA